MIKRIVKLTFTEENITAFEALFEESNNKIRAFQGCLHLELWQSKSDARIFFTFSIWKSENDLENYRRSPIFKDIWQRTKSLFAEKAEAWTVNERFF